MGKLLLARADKPLKQKYFRTESEIKRMHDDFLAIEDGACKHLLWKYGVGEGIISPAIREIEFSNWLEKFFPNLLK